MSNEIKQFETNLQETLLWCCSRFSMTALAESLRSPELRPDRNIVAETSEIDVIRQTVENVVERRWTRHGARMPPCGWRIPTVPPEQWQMGGQSGVKN